RNLSTSDSSSRTCCWSADTKGFAPGSARRDFGWALERSWRSLALSAKARARSRWRLALIRFWKKRVVTMAMTTPTKAIVIFRINQWRIWRLTQFIPSQGPNQLDLARAGLMKLLLRLWLPGASKIWGKVICSD